MKFPTSRVLPASKTAPPQLLVNLGCGASYHVDWLNLDFFPVSREVQKADLRSGIPLPNAYCTVVYHSHILEHFSRDDAEGFLRECHRVLKPGGIIRVVVPDLEQIARQYIAALERTLAGEPDRDYDWLVIELLDQMTRQHSGGHMFEAIARAEDSERALIRQRLGLHGEALLSAAAGAGVGRSFRDRLKRVTLGRLLIKIKVSIVRIIIRLVAGRRFASAWDEAVFRETGEVHRWMYDRHSLAKLLKQCGFEKPSQTSAFESAIPNFASYELDVSGSGIRKADSLFMEARKPAGAS